MRKLVQMAGHAIEEIPASGALTECCGFGGLVFNANPDLSKKIIRARAAQSPREFIAYCAMCRDRLASTGKRTLHVLDLLWPASETPGLRQDPGFSRRQDTLALARRDFLARIWHEEEPGKANARIPLRMSPETRQMLEDRFILVSDVHRVLEAWESRGVYFINPEKGSMIACFRPSRVCFWVEFIRDRDGADILDAWSHRMEVDANRDRIPGPPTLPLGATVLCGPCGLSLEHYKNHMTYLGSRFDVALPQCSRCGAVFISPDLARGKIAEVEKILEDK